MPDVDPIGEILHLAHHAAGDPTLWDEVMVRLRAHLNAPLIAFIDHNFITHQGEISHAAGIDERFRALYRARSLLRAPETQIKPDRDSRHKTVCPRCACNRTRPQFGLPGFQFLRGQILSPCVSRRKKVAPWSARKRTTNRCQPQLFAHTAPFGR